MIKILVYELFALGKVFMCFHLNLEFCQIACAMKCNVVHEI